MTTARRIAGLAILAMAALQFAWHGLLAPPASMSPWLLAAVFAAPLLPALVLLAKRSARAPFWGALAALLYFCHGVMIAWAAPAERTLALVETALAAVLIVAASWDGMRGRFARKPSPPPAV